MEFNIGYQVSHYYYYYGWFVTITINSNEFMNGWFITILLITINSNRVPPAMKKPQLFTVAPLLQLASLTCLGQASASFLALRVSRRLAGRRLTGGESEYFVVGKWLMVITTTINHYA